MENMNASTAAIGRPITWGETSRNIAENAQKKGKVTGMMKKMTRAARKVYTALMANDLFRWIVKRYGLALLAALMLWGWTSTACAITANRVRKETEERVRAEVTSELRAGFQQYLDDQELQQKQEQFLSGDKSFENAVEELAEPMSHVIAAYAMEFGVNQEGLNTIGWSFCARLAKNSTEFGKTPTEILEKAGAWEGGVVGHATRPQDLELSKEIARDYLSGKYPDGYTTDLTFFTRETGGKIIARNEFKTGPYTVYWYYGK